MVRFILVDFTTPAGAGKRMGMTWACMGTCASHLPTVPDAAALNAFTNETIGAVQRTSQDAAANGDIASEWALLVDVVACKRSMATMFILASFLTSSFPAG